MCEGINSTPRRRNTQSSVHRPHRIVISFKGKALEPGAFQKMLEDKECSRAQLAVEADKTRWWLQQQEAWKTSEHVCVAKMTDDKDGTPKEVFVYPIYDNPNYVNGKMTAEFFLGFDAKVYYITDRYKQFDATDPRAHADVLHLIKRLRGIRNK